MFKQDQPRVQKWCTNPDKLVDVISMVLLSVRQPWSHIGLQLDDVRRNKATSKYLFGFKRPGYLYAIEHKVKLYRKIRDYRSGRCDTIDLMRELLKVPGLGLAKAGFVVQLTCGDVGCLDSHNLKRFGIGKKFMRLPNLVSPAKQIAAVDDRISAYVALCGALGGSEFLWDSWCDLVAANMPTRFTDGDHVSRLHYEYLVD